MAENKFFHRTFCAIGFMVALTQTGYPAAITSSIDKSSLSVGDRLHFQVSINADKGSECIPPEPEQYLKSISVKEWNITKKENAQTDSFTVDYILTTYIPENCTIPPLPFILKAPSSIDTLYSNQIPLQFISVITEKDSSVDIRDLKSQQDAGTAPKWWLSITISLIGVAIIILLILLLTKKLRKTPPPPPPIPPYQEAVMALGVLHGKRLLEKGLVREYVFELSEIFKRYIERRFAINASEFTTEEMIAWSGVSGLDKNLKHRVEWFFRTTDPVKFARVIPDSATTEQFSTEVTAFLEATKPVEQQSSETVNKLQQTVQESQHSCPSQRTDPEAVTTTDEVR